MTRSLLVIGILGLFAGACGSGSGRSSLLEGNDAELTDCTFLQKVQGTAGDYDRSAEFHAKSAARKRATALGATHVKWIVPCCTYVEADAYKCDMPSE